MQNVRIESAPLQKQQAIHSTQNSDFAYLIELLEMGEVSHHASLALLPGLLLLRAVDLDLRDPDQVLQVVVPRLLAQALILRKKKKG